MSDENSILSNYINQFKKENEIKSNNEDIVFEYFSGYTMAMMHSQENISDPCSLNSGGTNDKGIDSIAIIINGKAIGSHAEFIESYDKYSELNVKYIFVQSKNKPGSQGASADISNFLDGVRVALKSPVGDVSTEDGLSNNEFSDRFKEFVKLREDIESCEILSKSPEIYIYFVNRSDNGSSDNLLEDTKIITAVESLKNQFSNYPVDFDFVDAKKLCDAYSKLKGKSKATFNNSTLQKFYGASDENDVEIYFGYLPLGEYVKIIHDSDGEINEKVFYENVRNYRGDTTINKSIRKSLDNMEEHPLFFARNNGVTIIAKNIYKAGKNNIRIENYNVVNGCQTSYILNEYYKEKKAEINISSGVEDSPYLGKSSEELDELLRMNQISGKDYLDAQKINREKSEKESNFKKMQTSICIPVRIIESSDKNLVSSIVKSTNTQNSIIDLDLESMKEFHKKLEIYFERKYGGGLLYERREGSAKTRNSDVKYINTDSLMRSFASLYLYSAHLSARSPKKLRSYFYSEDTDLKPSIFSDAHAKDAYYLAAKMYVDLRDHLTMRNFKGNRPLYNKNMRYKWYILYSMLIELQDYMVKNHMSVKGCDAKDRNGVLELAIGGKNISKHLDAYKNSDFNYLYNRACTRLDLALYKFQKHNTIESGEISKNAKLMDYIANPRFECEPESPCSVCESAESSEAVD